MDNNLALVEKFYDAFAAGDSKTMNACYADDIIFFDPVFDMLHGSEVKMMWQMLNTRAKDFSLTHGAAKDEGDGYYTCDWEASYTFGATGRRVVNKVKANMKLADGKIMEHSDAFSLHRWAAQALGFKGWLFGWNKFFQQKVKAKARQQLFAYINGK